MKNIKIIFGIAGLLTLLSCSKDLLDKTPYDKIVIGNFYQTPEEVYQAVIAAYDVLQYDDFNNFHMLSEIASDNCTGGGGSSDPTNVVNIDAFEPYVDVNAEPWQKYWQGIYRANLVIEHIDDATWDDQDDRNRILAEAHFLRAYFYFDLVRLFGYVPMVDKVLSPEEAFLPQEEPEEIYSLIADDLIHAIANLPDAGYRSIPTNEYGRATKWAAEALMCRVFLYYTGYYNQTDLAGKVSISDARTYIDDVINNSGHGLLDDYTYLWQYSFDDFAGEDNKETVFAIKFTYKGQGDWELYDGNRWQVMVSLRNQVIPPYANGWGVATVNTNLWEAYDTADTRRSGSIISWDYEGIEYSIGDQRQYTGYHWRKYVALTESPESETLQTANYSGDYQIDNFFDDVVIRFADVLLMGAELHLQDNLTLAQEHYDEVRDRAFQDETHRITLTNDEAGKQLIFEERRLELALEGQRYWDLLRYDGLAGNLNYAKTAIDASQPYPVTFRTITEGLFQIPETQIDRSNGTLLQNPGWD